MASVPTPTEITTSPPSFSPSPSTQEPIDDSVAADRNSSPSLSSPSPAPCSPTNKSNSSSSSGNNSARSSCSIGIEDNDNDYDDDDLNAVDNKDVVVKEMHLKIANGSEDDLNHEPEPVPVPVPADDDDDNWNQRSLSKPELEFQPESEMQQQQKHESTPEVQMEFAHNVELPVSDEEEPEGKPDVCVQLDDSHSPYVLLEQEKDLSQQIECADEVLELRSDEKKQELEMEQTQYQDQVDNSLQINATDDVQLNDEVQVRPESARLSSVADDGNDDDDDETDRQLEPISTFDTADYADDADANDLGQEAEDIAVTADAGLETIDAADDESADKPDYGLNEIPSLKNIKSRFEHGEEENHDGTNGSTTVHVKRSESIASRLAKFKSLELAENGHANGNHDSSESSQSSSSDEDDDRDPQVVRETKKKERPHEIPIDVIQAEVIFSGMSDLKTQWESVGTSPTKEERAREIQDDLAKLRLRMCHGKGSLKAKYESACEESVKTPARSAQSVIDVNGGEIHANSLKEKFERGELMSEEEVQKAEKILKEKEDDLSVFKEQGTAADARHLFKEIDRSASSAQLSVSTSATTNVKRSPSMRSREVLCGANQTQAVEGEIVRSSDKLEDDIMAPVDLSAKFKFFENYQDNQGTMEKKRFTITPPREPVKEESPEPQPPHDPNIVRACDRDDDIVVVTDTAKKMLDKFRQLEIQAERDESSSAAASILSGPKKPLKRITPPREYTRDEDTGTGNGNGDYSSLEPEVSRNPDIVRCCDKIEDEFLVQNSSRKAKNLKEKFERWDELDNSSSSAASDRHYVDSENRKNNVVEDELLLLQQQQPCPDMAKNLKAKFEAIREESIRSQEISKPKVNRFIDFGGNTGDLCNICTKKVYPMEKLEVSGLKLHKTCFRCSQCNTILRMDNYTINGDCLYCCAHFKQLFKQCGNYDVGFGREQHKERWSRSRSTTPTSINGHDSFQIQHVNGID